ncbi:metastasis-associated protein MTA1-like [Ailuropoda melanoleuca]|uniref:metastasis-associated protein MTA1-like n=1 Tax=Ailuropoda melanoleuca TaxID=9646 RepID=UPI00149421F7|nr:metastasis-associated protein MTA1-like [Ailuropoda melanoleuca]
MGPSRNLLLNGKSYPTKVRLIRGGSLPPVKRRRMNWIDAPDDVFYMATDETRKIRKLLSSSETKRAARRPYKPIALRQSQALPLRPAASIAGVRPAYHPAPGRALPQLSKGSCPEPQGQPPAGVPAAEPRPPCVLFTSQDTVPRRPQGRALPPHLAG